MDDLEEKEPAANQPSKGVSLIAIGHALVTVGLVGLFVTLIMVETPLAASFRWGACFGLASAGVVLLRSKESWYVTAGIILLGCALWVVRGKQVFG
jgi:hypothetical protein